MIAFVGALAVGATGAFFSDTETSTGNTFTAGKLDLKIDSECHYYQNGVDVGCGPIGTNGVGVGQWRETDLEDGVHKFFDFGDIKPGDWGEDTISLHVYDNDAWGKMKLTFNANKDNGCTEPEESSDTTCDDNLAPWSGELYQKMQFMTWLDQGMIPGFQCGGLHTPGIPKCPADPYEGDNIWQDGLVPDPTTPIDPINPTPRPDIIVHEPMVPTRTVAMDSVGHPVDPGNPNSVTSFFDIFVDFDEAMKGQTIAPANGVAPCPADGGHHDYGLCHGIAADGRLVGSVTYYIGWKWLLPESVGNEVQSDSLSGDMTFTAEQHRNNPLP